MKILFIGDVVGKRGQEAFEKYLPQLKQVHKPQITIVNGENISDGKGISQKLYKWLLNMGADVITLGNHAWDNQEIYDFIDEAKCLVRPINLPPETPGKGVYYFRYNQVEIAVVNVLGSIFMSPCIEPFNFLPSFIQEIRQRTTFIFVDFHAEATSEKQALGYLLDGQVSAVIGTHTHVQTNDARILPKGTAYQTDVGMTGTLDSVIGFNYQQVVKKFQTQLPMRLEQAQTDNLVLSACIIDLDNHTGKAKKIDSLYMTDTATTHSKRYRHV